MELLLEWLFDQPRGEMWMGAGFPLAARCRLDLWV